MRVDTSQILAQGGMRVRQGTDADAQTVRSSDEHLTEDEVQSDAASKHPEDELPAQKTDIMRDFSDKTLAEHASKLAELNMPVKESTAAMMRELMAQHPKLSMDEAAFLASNKITGDEDMIKAALGIMSGEDKTHEIIKQILSTLDEVISETGKEQTESTAKESVKEPVKETVKEAPETSTKEPIKETPETSVKESPDKTIKEPAKDTTAEPKAPVTDNVQTDSADKATLSKLITTVITEAGKLLETSGNKPSETAESSQGQPTQEQTVQDKSIQEQPVQETPPQGKPIQQTPPESAPTVNTQENTSTLGTPGNAPPAGIQENNTVSVSTPPEASQPETVSAPQPSETISTPQPPESSQPETVPTPQQPQSPATQNPVHTNVLNNDAQIMARPDGEINTQPATALTEQPLPADALKTVLQHIPNVDIHDISKFLPKTMEQVTPENFPQASMQADPQTTAQDTPGVLPQTTAQDTPGVLPQTPAQDTPGVLPQTTAQVIPDAAPPLAADAKITDTPAPLQNPEPPSPQQSETAALQQSETAALQQSETAALQSAITKLLSNIPQFQETPQSALDKFSGMLLRLAEDTGITKESNINTQDGEAQKADIEQLATLLEKTITKIDRKNANTGQRLQQAKEELYARLMLAREEIERAPQSVRQQLHAQTQKLTDHVRVINSIEQFAYMQLPVQLRDEQRTAELYVFKRKKSKNADPDNVNILLSIDLEFMGHWEALMNVRGKDVRLNMEVAGESEKEHFLANTVILHDLLQEEGFRLVDTAITISEQETTPLNALSALDRFGGGRQGMVNYVI